MKVLECRATYLRRYAGDKLFFRPESHSIACVHAMSLHGRKLDRSCDRSHRSDGHMNPLLILQGVTVGHAAEERGLPGQGLSHESRDPGKTCDESGDRPDFVILRVIQVRTGLEPGDGL